VVYCLLLLVDDYWLLLFFCHVGVSHNTSILMLPLVHNRKKRYFGEYLLGARHGPGIYNRQDGVDVYIGFWAHGVAKGRGFRRLEET
jgi:hypothetical protein